MVRSACVIFEPGMKTFGLQILIWAEHLLLWPFSVWSCEIHILGRYSRAARKSTDHQGRGVGVQHF